MAGKGGQRQATERLLPQRNMTWKQRNVLWCTRVGRNYFSLFISFSLALALALSSADPSPLSVRVFGRLPVPLDIQQDRFFIKIYVPLSIWPNHFSASPYFFFTLPPLSILLPRFSPAVRRFALYLQSTSATDAVWHSTRRESLETELSSSTFNASE